MEEKVNQTIPADKLSESQLTSARKLNEIIQYFYEDKKHLDGYKKSTDKYNKEIKELMQELGTTEFGTDTGLIAKMNIQKRESFNENKLIDRLKDLDIITPIKTIEVVDMEELENVIYNGQLDASKITDCKQIKEVITLKVSKKKGE